MCILNALYIVSNERKIQHSIVLHHIRPRVSYVAMLCSTLPFFSSMCALPFPALNFDHVRHCITKYKMNLKYFHSFKMLF